MQWLFWSLFVVYFPEPVRMDLARVSSVRPRTTILQAQPLTTGLPTREKMTAARISHLLTQHQSGSPTLAEHHWSVIYWSKYRQRSHFLGYPEPLLNVYHNSTTCSGYSSEQNSPGPSPALMGFTCYCSTTGTLFSVPWLSHSGLPWPSVSHSRICNFLWYLKAGSAASPRSRGVRLEEKGCIFSGQHFYDHMGIFWWSSKV